MKFAYVNENREWAEFSFYPPFVDVAKYPAGERGFGIKFHPIDHIWKMHTGQDYACPDGTQIIPIACGIVHSVGYDETNGNYIRILHPNGFISGYAHLKDRPILLIGEKVNREVVIGLAGNTGHSQGNHLHLTVWSLVGRACIDPLLLFK